MVHEIVIWPDPVLKKKAAPVARFDAALHKLLADMTETMYAADGVGLAAPQIGISQRVVVIDTSPRQEGQKLLEVINPEIVAARGEVVYNEGCLSIPGEVEEIKRHEEVAVRFFDREGKKIELEATGLLAIAFQHEIDHIDGMLFVDRLSALKRELIKRRMKKLKAERAAQKAAGHAHESGATPAL